MNESNAPAVQDLAKAAEASYSMARAGNKKERLEQMKDMTPSGYSVLPEYTDRMISTFMKDRVDAEDLTHFIIAHRGSDFNGSQAKKDLVSDWNIILGNTDGDAVHKRRGNKTTRIVKALKDRGDVYLTGHSLGGSTAYHSMLNSSIVRDNVKEAHLFNSGSSPLQTQSIKSGTKLYDTMNNKVTHHNIKDDLVSSSSKNTYLGKHKTYTSKASPSLGRRAVRYLSSLVFGGGLWKMKENLEDRLKKHSIQNFTS